MRQTMPFPPGIACSANQSVAASSGATVTSSKATLPCAPTMPSAMANTISAVVAGSTHVQVTANGYGERTGNADLFAVAGNLTTKLGLSVMRVNELTHVSQAIATIANVPLNPHQPYVGASAFAHKGGLHASALKVDPLMYNHIEPESVGNRTRVLVTEQAGKASVELKCAEFGLDLSPEMAARVVRRIKDLEVDGWSFETADASLELLVRKEMGETHGLTPDFYRVLLERGPHGATISEATVEIGIDDDPVLTTARGSGPIEALDAALRRALEPRFQWLADVRMVDYKVRRLTAGTGSVARVLVVSADSDLEWTTVGAHTSIVEASLLALSDAFAFKAMLQRAPALR